MNDNNKYDNVLFIIMNKILFEVWLWKQYFIGLQEYTCVFIFVEVNVYIQVIIELTLMPCN